MNNSKTYTITAMIAIAAFMVATGCGKKAPAEANAALKESLTALSQKQPAVFVKAVLPSQQAGATALPQWPFFNAVKSFKIDNEFDIVENDGSASIMTVLYFDADQKKFSTLKFCMKKEGGTWYIDLNETIKKQTAANGGHAFEVWKFVEE